MAEMSSMPEVAALRKMSRFTMLGLKVRMLWSTTLSVVKTVRRAVPPSVSSSAWAPRI